MSEPRPILTPADVRGLSNAGLARLLDVFAKRDTSSPAEAHTRVARRLKGLRYTRIDLVDKGASVDGASGEGAHVVLFKREATPAPTAAPAAANDAHQHNGGTHMGHDSKALRALRSGGPDADWLAAHVEEIVKLAVDELRAAAVETTARAVAEAELERLGAAERVTDPRLTSEQAAAKACTSAVGKQLQGIAVEGLRRGEGGLLFARAVPVTKKAPAGPCCEAMGEIERQAAEAREKSPKLTKAQAVDQVTKERPELYTQHKAAH